MEHVTVYRNPRSYSHNPDVAVLANGEWVLVFREAPCRRRCTHIDPLSKATLLRSTDHGRTWDRHDPVVAARGAENIGIQDPSIAALSDGRLICNFFTWDAPPDAPYGAVVPGTFAVRSSDGGRTWEQRHVTVDQSGRDDAYTATTDAVVELSGGELLMPIYDSKLHAEGGGDRAIVFRSTDGGDSWHEWGTIGYDPFGNLDFSEPALAVLPSGKVVAKIREEKRKECLWQSESTDGGKTWARPWRTPMWGFPADLLVLKSGSLLCTYGYRRRPYGVRACISRDEGRTWDVRKELVIRNDGVGPDVGYPSSVQAPDGTIFTAYYLSDPPNAEGADAAAARNPDDPAAHFSDGGTRYIAGSFYREW